MCHSNGYNQKHIHPPRVVFFIQKKERHAGRSLQIGKGLLQNFSILQQTFFLV